MQHYPPSSASFSLLARSNSACSQLDTLIYCVLATATSPDCKLDRSTRRKNTKYNGIIHFILKRDIKIIPHFCRNGDWLAERNASGEDSRRQW
jgi:hypothetical protein